MAARKGFSPAGAVPVALWWWVLPLGFSSPRDVVSRGPPGPRFHKLAQEEATKQGQDFNEYMAEMEGNADAFQKSKKPLDRGEAINKIEEAVMKEGLMTLILGGKNLGKTLLKDAAIQRVEESSTNKVTVLGTDMRGVAGRTLLDILVDKASDRAKKQPSIIMRLLPTLMPDIIRFFGNFLESKGDKGTKGTADAAATLLERLSGVGADLDDLINFFFKIGNKTSIIVDEANLALPGLLGPKVAKLTLAKFTELTKQERRASVILISSEFGYPYRLQEIGFDLRDIGRIIVVGEVPEKDMMEFLQENLGMGQELAQEFYDYFGGDVYTTCQAIGGLKNDEERFDPFAVVVCPGLVSCIEDAEARAHLENIVEKGYSWVNNVNTDRGARLIAEMNVGGVISKGAITFGLPEGIWNGTKCMFAVIPSSYHVRCRIAAQLMAWKEKAKASVGDSGKWGWPWGWP